MKTVKFAILFTLLFSLNGFCQVQLPLKFRVEKQAMSTPMSALEDAFFINYYYSKPVNVNFDGSTLNMSYDNGATLIKKSVTEVDRNKEYDDDNLTIETILYTDNNDVSDTISLVVDYEVGYVQIVMPTKNSKGEYYGYTSYRKFTKDSDLALK